MSLISTYTGRVIDVLDPQPENIDIKDIAHHLSLICRFNGACEEHYSVAQHSVLVMHLVPEGTTLGIRLEALLHDAAEAYVGDLTSPVKIALREKSLTSDFDHLERRFQKAINKKFGLVYDANASGWIHQADLIARATERRDVCTFPNKVTWPELKNVKPRTERISFMPSAMAKYTFLLYFKQLMEKRG